MGIIFFLKKEEYEELRGLTREIRNFRDISDDFLESLKKEEHLDIGLIDRINTILKNSSKNRSIRY